MPSIEDWDESNLQALIRNHTQESLHLDYKASGALRNTDINKNEISKDVSAFANSDGGKIIYGIEEQNHLPIRIDSGVASTGKREWLEQVINSRIEPRIHDVKIKQIDLTSNQNRAVFAVQIPASFTAHQAHDRRYYRRYNFQSIQMHDYEVKMVINRYREPVLKLLASSIHEEPVSLLLDGELLFVLELENLGKMSAKSASIEFFFPMALQTRAAGDWRTRQTEYEGHRGRSYELILGLLESPPLYPGKKVQLSGLHSARGRRIYITNVDDFVIQNIDIPVFFEIYAEDMAPKKGKIILRFAGSYLSFVRE